MPIPWYYMWSDNYRIFHEIMKDSIIAKQKSEFQLCPIEVPQKRFDSELYSNDGSHFWSGSCIKLNYIIESLKIAKEKSEPYILFTDIDIFVKSNIHSDIKQYIDNNVDMVFMKELDGINFGFMLIRICDEVVQFFTTIRSMLIVNDGLDQQCVNELLPSYTGKYACFDEQDFILSYKYDIKTAPSYKVIQVLCSNTNREHNIFEKLLSMNTLIDMRPYMKYSLLSNDLIIHMNRILVNSYGMVPELLYNPS